MTIAALASRRIARHRAAARQGLDHRSGHREAARARGSVILAFQSGWNED